MGTIPSATLRSLIDALPILCYTVTDDLTIQWANKGAAFAAATRKPPSLKGARCFSAVFGRSAPCDPCPALLTLNTGTTERRETTLNAKGKTTHALITAVRLAGTPAGRPLIVEMVQDITAHKKVQEELTRLNEFNAAIIDHTPVAIFTIDPTGKFASVNPAGAILSGLGPEAKEKLFKFNWLVNPFTVRCGLADYIRKGLEGEPFELWDFPFTTYRGDRSQYIHFVGVPLRGKDGSVEGLVCLIEETTERVRIAAQLMQEAKMSAIGRLATGIAHELNNPLATLVAHSELACDLMKSISGGTLSPVERAELESYMEIIQEQAFRCRDIIKDFLSLPRKEGLDRHEIDVNTVLEGIVPICSRPNQEITVTMDLDPRLPRVRGDADALRQIFLNILRNAMDAVESRPGAEIRVSTEGTSRTIEVSIEDNGVGIPESMADLIFEPFFTTKGSRKGIGLGLTLCYDLLKRMGGHIEALPRQGGGSIFRISLPLETPSPKENHG